MRRLIAWIAVCWLALSAAAQAHEITFSHVDIRLDPGGTTIAVRLPIKALLQEEPSALPAGASDASLRAAPLPPDQTAALKRLLEQRLQLKAGARPLPFTITGVTPAGDDVALTARAAAVPGGLAGTAALFPDDGLAKVFVTVSRGGDLAGEYALDRDGPSFELDAPRQPLGRVIATFVGEGVHHIFIGPDHILFVLALVLLGGRLWSQIKIVTAFTAAHSITLALAALGIVQLPSRLTESLIAFSIVVVGLHNLWRLRRGGDAGRGVDPRIAFAFGFGLIHGFGFASVLGELELPRYALAWSLAAFNIGVEIGQATIVLAAAPLLALLHRRASPRVERRVLMAATGLIVAAGAFWLIQRALGL